MTETKQRKTVMPVGKRIAKSPESATQEETKPLEHRDGVINPGDGSEGAGCLYYKFRDFFCVVAAIGVPIYFFNADQEQQISYPWYPIVVILILLLFNRRLPYGLLTGFWSRGRKDKDTKSD